MMEDDCVTSKSAEPTDAANDLNESRQIDASNQLDTTNQVEKSWFEDELKEPVAKKLCGADCEGFNKLLVLYSTTATEIHNLKEATSTMMNEHLRLVRITKKLNQQQTSVMYILQWLFIPIKFNLS